jgi:hypothetical protein
MLTLRKNYFADLDCGIFKKVKLLLLTLVSRYCWVCACVFVFMENKQVIQIYLSKKFRSFVLVSLRSSNSREARER